MIGKQRTVYWSVLYAPEMNWRAVHACLEVAQHCRARGYTHLPIHQYRTDRARNRLARAFYDAAKNDHDTLVMLDADHIHPADIVQRLVQHDQPIVSALAFQREPPYRPCAHYKTTEGKYVYPEDCSPDKGLVPVAFSGFGAVAIQRWVFKKLTDAGAVWPWFRYVSVLEGDLVSTGEDVYFARTCERANIPMFCDFGLVTPHLGEMPVDTAMWQAWTQAHATKGAV